MNLPRTLQNCVREAGRRRRASRARSGLLHHGQCQHLALDGFKLRRIALCIRGNAASLSISSSTRPTRCSGFGWSDKNSGDSSLSFRLRAFRKTAPSPAGRILNRKGLACPTRRLETPPFANTGGVRLRRRMRRAPSIELRPLILRRYRWQFQEILAQPALSWPGSCHGAAQRATTHAPSLRRAALRCPRIRLPRD